MKIPKNFTDNEWMNKISFFHFFILKMHLKVIFIHILTSDAKFNGIWAT
jgi:hypothetical protein